jgi:hypothetical protein
LQTTPAPAVVEPEIFYDSGNVKPSLAAWVYVNGTKSGIYFPRNSFATVVLISVFFKKIEDIAVSPVRLSTNLLPARA